MSDEYNVRRAAALLGGLSAHGRTPDPDDEASARRTLATARLDRELRTTARSGIVLDDVQAGHLVGLLLSGCGVKGEVVTALEHLSRVAVRSAQDGTR